MLLIFFFLGPKRFFHSIFLMAVFWPLRAGAITDEGRYLCIGKTIGSSIMVTEVIPATDPPPDDCIGTLNNEKQAKGCALNVAQKSGQSLPSNATLRGEEAIICRYENVGKLRRALEIDNEEGDEHNGPLVPNSRSYFHTHVTRCLFHQGKLILCIDIICGLLLLKLGYARHLALALDEYGNAIETMGRQLTIYFMAAPADLKLNNAATSVYGQVLLYVFHAIQTSRVGFLPPENLEKVITLLLCTGIIGGAAGCVDLIRLFALPFFWVMRANRRMWELTRLLSTLFSVLFRGKKWNVIRLRHDSVDTDYMQSALCAYLFAIVAFLFPTLLVTKVMFTVSYYVIFLISIPPRAMASLRHVRLQKRTAISIDVVDYSTPTIVELKVKDELNLAAMFGAWLRRSCPVSEW